MQLKRTAACEMLDHQDLVITRLLANSSRFSRFGIVLTSFLQNEGPPTSQRIVPNLEIEAINAVRNESRYDREMRSNGEGLRPLVLW
jgi:hypothetical protein